MGVNLNFTCDYTVCVLICLLAFLGVTLTKFPSAQKIKNDTSTDIFDADDII